MQNFNPKNLARFKVQGNVLALTNRFDPRLQPRAALELLNIMHGLVKSCKDKELVIDIRDSQVIPSMMLGFLNEAEYIVDKAGKKLKVRIKKKDYQTFEQLKVWGKFKPLPEEKEIADEDTYLTYDK